MDNKTNQQPLLDEIVETIGTAFPSKLLTALLFFFYSPVRLFRWIHQRRFDILIKPVAFFFTCLALSIFIGSLHHNIFDPGWYAMYNNLADSDKRELKKLFTGQEALMPVDALDSMIRTKMGLNNDYAEVNKGLMLLYLKVHNKTDLYDKVDLAYKRAERSAPSRSAVNALVFTVLVLPYAAIFHWVLRSRKRSLTDTIHHTLYMSGIFFLFCIAPSHLSNVYADFDFYLILCCFFMLLLFVYHVIIIKKTHEVGIGRILFSDLVSGSIMLPILNLLIVSGF